MSRPPAARPHPAAAALRLRCPACGRGRLFTGWFTMHQRCPACGLDLRRAPEAWLEGPPAIAAETEPAPE